MTSTLIQLKEKKKRKKLEKLKKIKTEGKEFASQVRRKVQQADVLGERSTRITRDENEREDETWYEAYDDIAG